MSCDLIDSLEPRRLFAGAFALTPFDVSAGSAGSYPAQVVRAGSHWYAIIGAGPAIDAPRGVFVGDISADGDYMPPHVLTPAISGEWTTSLTPFDDRVAFARGTRLMITDAAGTEAHAVGPDFPTNVTNLVAGRASDGTPRLYFAAGTTSGDAELWISDGTDAGTRRVADIRPGTTGSLPAHLTPTADGRLFFDADNGINGRELWVSDGTEVGTQLVRDVRAGTQSSSFGSIHPIADHRVAYQTNGRLYTSDGTSANTQIVETTYRGFASRVWPVTGGVVYYTTITSPTPFLFYNGTTSPRDIGTLNTVVGGYSGTSSSDGKTLFFFGGDSYTARRGVYAINGTGIRFIGGDSQVRQILAAGDGAGAYIVTANQSSGAWDLNYYADVGATPVLINSRPASDNLLLLAADGDRLLMTFNDASMGREIWSAHLDETPPVVVSSWLDFSTKPHVIRMELSEASTNQSWTVGFALSVRRLSDNTTLPAGSFTLQTNADGLLSYVANPAVIPDGVLTDGLYEATLQGGTLRDAAGNVQADPHTFQFSFLRGDVNGDRRVDFSDLLVVAQHYGQTGRDYTRGNLDYSANGSVDFADLLLLSQRYGTTLALALGRDQIADLPVRATRSSTPRLSVLRES